MIENRDEGTENLQGHRTSTSAQAAHTLRPVLRDVVLTDKERRLIDAVPDMLEALEMVEKSISAFLKDRVEELAANHHSPLADWDFGESHGGSIVRIRAAIAKATGQ